MKLFRMECVYAGPEQMKKRRENYKMSEVYAGPEEMSEKNEYKAEAIYACPMEITEEQNEETKLPYPMNHAENSNIFEGVYAAPETLSKGSCKNAYAAAENNAKEYCRSCGAMMSQGDNFCSQCGAKREADV